MATRTIQSPGVEIFERDLSLRTTFPTGTNVFVAGFSHQGPTDEVINVSSIGEFEQVFGTPTNAAERYFYHTVRATLQSPATVKVTRLPYGENLGEGFGDNYSALVYPVVPIPDQSADVVTTPAQLSASGSALTQAEAFWFGEPTHVTLTEDEYYTIKRGGIAWRDVVGHDTNFADNDLASLGAAGLIVLNKEKLGINERYEGYYLGIGDNTTISPSTSYNTLTQVKSIDAFYNNGFVTVANSRLGFSLSSVAEASVGYVSGTTSELLEGIPNFEIIGDSFDDVLAIGVFKLKTSIFGKSETSLEQSLEEGYFGSFNSQRKLQDSLGGPKRSFYLQSIVDENALNIEILINPNISENSEWSDENGDDNNPIRKVRVFRGTGSVPSSLSAHTQYLEAITNVPADDLWFRPANSLYTFSVYSPSLDVGGLKTVGSLPAKVDRVLRKVESKDLFDIDLTLDAGLSTIWASVNTLSSETFEDHKSFDITELDSQSADVVSGTATDSWRTIFGLFDAFAREGRKDHLHISDPLRQIFVQGKNFKTLSDKTKNFSSNVYWPLRNLYQLANTSFSTTYVNWYKGFDSFSNQEVWLPSSGYHAALMAITDSTLAPWQVAAGYNRGIVQGVLDIAINPNQKQRDLLYKVGLNPVAFIPNDGVVTMGQKTLLGKPSAFDRINVRRLFLVLQRATGQIAKYFVFEPNTVFTRSRLLNTLVPLFELAKNTEGLYDYMLVCDERNNTPMVIDNNELKVDVYIKPVRSAEFILVNFHATRSDQDFSQLV